MYDQHIKSSLIVVIYASFHSSFVILFFNFFTKLWSASGSHDSAVQLIAIALFPSHFVFVCLVPITSVLTSFCLIPESRYSTDDNTNETSAISSIPTFIYIYRDLHAHIIVSLFSLPIVGISHLYHTTKCARADQQLITLTFPLHHALSYYNDCRTKNTKRWERPPLRQSGRIIVSFCNVELYSNPHNINPAGLL